MIMAHLKLEEGLCNCLALRQASRHITAFYDQVLAGTGLRVTQFSILYKLARCGGVTINELSEVMVMDRTTLARNLKPLEREGLVHVIAGEDRRERVVDLTENGLKKIKELLPLWRKAQRQFETSFGPDRAKELRGTLRAVVSSDMTA